MNERHLIDTNVVIALFANEARTVAAFAASSEVFVSAVVLGELFFGANHSLRAVENISRINDFADQVAVLDINSETASVYGAMKSKLKTLGKPIPENDLWIAASALQHNLIMVSRDDHFASVPGLKVVAW